MKMSKPIAKHEIYTEILPNNHVFIYAESDGMKERVAIETPQFGQVGERPNNAVDVKIRPNFDQYEVAQWLGRGGLVVAVNYNTIPPVRSVIADGVLADKRLDDFEFVFDSELHDE